ncbi:MAG: L-histidine N(alpha)-methyltransferase [Desulfobacteraceae bacterium]|nr:L-histidine N(alpha)-methyltransferase [Desulfobacteraceae bacterium]
MESIPIQQQAEGESKAAFLRRFARDVRNGLSLPRKRLPCKYLYDDTGSRLFSQIMDLTEYYPARCELEIFQMHKAALADLFGGPPLNLVELGAGDGTKTRVLIGQMRARKTDFTYVPIDISRAAVDCVSGRFSRWFPGLRTRGITADYLAGLKWLSGQNHCRNIVLFLGSSIGNFPARDREAFLRNLRQSLNTGDCVLIGFDLVKDIAVMTRAYNDAEGITAAFNKNILTRINRELEADFDPGLFRFYSTWDADARAVQSYLVSTCAHQVHIRGLRRSFDFSAREAIHTESSHKFTRHQIRELAARNGFAVAAEFTDDAGYFTDCLWRAA